MNNFLLTTESMTDLNSRMTELQLCLGYNGKQSRVYEAGCYECESGCKGGCFSSCDRSCGGDCTGEEYYSPWR